MFSLYFIRFLLVVVSKLTVQNLDYKVIKSFPRVLFIRPGFYYLSNNDAKITLSISKLKRTSRVLLRHSACNGRWPTGIQVAEAPSHAQWSTRRYVYLHDCGPSHSLSAPALSAAADSWSISSGRLIFPLIPPSRSPAYLRPSPPRI